jgi:hypothetical protein
VYSVVLAEDRRIERFDGGVPLQRVACAACWKSWTLWPPFLYPGRQFAPDIDEAAGLAYLADPHATYVEVGRRYGCSWTSLWRWVGWLGGLASPEEILAAIVRMDAVSPALSLVPRVVPQDHRKAYSPERANVLLRAYRVLVLLCLLARVMCVAPADPSPLRWFLWAVFRAYPRPIGLREALVPAVSYRLARPP